MDKNEALRIIAEELKTCVIIDSGSIEWLTMTGPDMKREIINFGSTPG